MSEREATIPAFDLALSPYHLCTREPPAMLALTLGSHVVTMLPEPASGSGREDVAAAVHNAPRYLRLMESWRWSGPLWKSGVLASSVEGKRAVTELQGVYTLIREDPALECLRPLTRGPDELAREGGERALDALSADLLRGGPNPGINIPVTAALDQFAHRHDLIVVRSGAASIAQRAEQRLGARVFSVGLPILLRAGGGRIDKLRRDLAGPLGGLREAIARAFTSASEETEGDPARAAAATSEPDRAQYAQTITTSAAHYAREFATWAELGGQGDDENAERVTHGYVSLTGMCMPADAALRSSRAAIRTVQGASAKSSSAAPIAVTAQVDRRPLCVLIVREMNVRPEVA